MRVTLHRDFEFQAAHFLPMVPEGHPCARMHGHSYHVRIVVRGAVDPETGWLMDYADIEAAYLRVHAQIDHRCLNEIHGLSNPTCEVLSAWIWDQLSDLPGLCAVTVGETRETGCTYLGEAS